ncbi:MAG: prolipoprotein diacylglyceryl transferase family protein [Solirubrobacteraceae bacterium]
MLASLDIVLMGQSTVLAIGWLGCLMAGCCHGKPARWGVRYRDAHVQRGFARELAYVRLFPLQLVEFAAVLALVAAGSALILGDAAAGSAAGVYVVGYGVVRFGLEYHRGDHTRPFLRGVSNVQWTILAIVGAWVSLELAGVLPLAWWHVAAFAALAAAAAFARPRRELQAPHLHEVAVLVRELDAVPADRACTPPHSGSRSRRARSSATAPPSVTTASRGRTAR